MSVSLDPLKVHEFKILEQEAKALAAEGKLVESLNKFELARSICETPKVLNRIQRLKEHIQNLQKVTTIVPNAVSSVKFQSDSVIENRDFGNSSEKIITKKGCPSEIKDKGNVFEKPRILNDIQNVQASCSSAEVQKGIEMKLDSDDSKDIKTRDNTSVLNNEKGDEMNASLTPGRKEKYTLLYRRAGKLSSVGHFKEALKLLMEAKSICKTDKVIQRINDVEKFMEEANEGYDQRNDSMIEISKGFFIFHDIYNKLYPYQKEGVAWMWNLYKKNKGGVLGDDMGLGKTFQVIAFLSGMIDANLIKYILIIMPVSLLAVWENEFKKWCPGINLQYFHGKTKKERERSLLRIQRRGHVLLTSYGMVLNNIDYLTELDGMQFVWDYLILDEGHKIKNPTKTTKAVHDIPSRNRIVLTGTPIQNNLRELWALYEFAHQGTLLGSQKTFKMQYENIITRSREKDATVGEKRLGTEMAENLKNLIKPYFLRRTKDEVWENKNVNTGIKDLEAELGNLQIANKLTTRKNDLIVWLYMSDKQIELYNGFLHSEAVQNILCSKRSPLVELTVLKKICDHPRLLSQRACYELGLNEELRHENLLQELDVEAASSSSIENVSDETLINESGKLKFLITLLENLRESGHRTLVFSLSRKILDMIHRILIHRKWKVMRIDGTISKTEERERRIQLFQRDSSYPVFLLTTQVGGVGITLTSADRVIVYDPSWNPATDSQAVDRAYRIGQKRDVVVYRLMTCGSVEEKIYRRQIFKDSITRQAICTSDPYRYFSKQELRELFTLENPYHSATQVQLSEMHSSERKTDVSLDEHIAFLYSLNIFGISDHDLMFTKNVKDGTEDNDESCVSKDYIQRMVASAQQSIQAESSVTEQTIKLAGTYSKPYTESIPSFKKSLIKDAYKKPLLPEVIDLTKENDIVFKSPLSVQDSCASNKNLDMDIINFSLNSGKNEPVIAADSSCQKLEYCDPKESKSVSKDEEFLISEEVSKLEGTNEQKTKYQNISVLAEDEFLGKSVSEASCSKEDTVEENASINTKFIKAVEKNEILPDVDEKTEDLSRISKIENNSIADLEKNFENDYHEKTDVLIDNDVCSKPVLLQNSPVLVLSPPQTNRIVTSSPVKSLSCLQNVEDFLKNSLSDIVSDEPPVNYKRNHRRSCARPALVVSDSDSSQQASCPPSANASYNKLVEETDESDCDIKNDSFDGASFHSSPSSMSYVPSSIPNSPVSVQIKSKNHNTWKRGFQQQKMSASLNFRLQDFQIKNPETKNATSVSVLEKRYDDSIGRITPLKLDRSFNIQPNIPFEKALAASPVLCLMSPCKEAKPQTFGADIKSEDEDNDSPIKVQRKHVKAALQSDSESENDDSPVFKKKQVNAIASSESEDDDYKIPKSVSKRKVTRMISLESKNSSDDSEEPRKLESASNNLNSFIKMLSEINKSALETNEQSVNVSDNVFESDSSLSSGQHSKYENSSSSTSPYSSEADCTTLDEESCNLSRT